MQMSDAAYLVNIPLPKRLVIRMGENAQHCLLFVGHALCLTFEVCKSGQAPRIVAFRPL